MDIFGIKFAPFNIPFLRRLQTLSITIWFTLLVLSIPISIFLTIYLLFFTNYWWLILMYFVWICYDKDTCENGGRSYNLIRSITFCEKSWKYYHDCFPIKLTTATKDLQLNPKRNYLFCCFPHGIFPFGATCAFAMNSCISKRLFPDHRSKMATLSQHFFTPFAREIAFLINTISSTFRSIANVLQRPEGGNIVVLIPGGTAEAFYSRPGQYKILLNKRKGFVRLALKTGAPLVPVVSFGEVDVYEQLEGANLRKFQEFVKKLIGSTPIIILGRGFFQYSFGILPHRRPITVVVGDPIDVEKIEEPTREQIDDLHRKFTEAFVELFEQQKHFYIENAETVHLEL